MGGVDDLQPLIAALPLAAGGLVLLVPSRAPAGDARRPPAERAQEFTDWKVVMGWVGIGGQILVGVMYVSSGQDVSESWKWMLGLLWVALLALAAWVRAIRPVWTPLVPLVSAGILPAVVAMGAV